MTNFLLILKNSDIRHRLEKKKILLSTTPPLILQHFFTDFVLRPRPSWLVLPAGSKEWLVHSEEGKGRGW